MIIGRTCKRCERCCLMKLMQSSNERNLKSFDFGLAITEQAVRDQTDLPRGRIESELVSPCAKSFQNSRLPCFQLDVRHCRKPGVQNTLKIEDLLEMPGLEPGRERLLTHVE